MLKKTFSSWNQKAELPHRRTLHKYVLPYWDDKNDTFKENETSY